MTNRSKSYQSFDADAVFRSQQEKVREADATVGTLNDLGPVMQAKGVEPRPISWDGAVSKATDPESSVTAYAPHDVQANIALGGMQQSVHQSHNQTQK